MAEEQQTITLSAEQLRLLAFVLYDAGRADEIGGVALTTTSDGLINTMLTQTRAEWAQRMQRQLQVAHENLPSWLLNLQPAA